MSFRLRVLDEVSSTNDEVKRAIEEGEAEGFAVRACRQTGGYGRQGRAWSSPEGGLYVSVLLRPAVPVAQLPTLSLVAGLALRRALAAAVPADVASRIQVKWPNDLVVLSAPAVAVASALQDAPVSDIAPVQTVASAPSILLDRSVSSTHQRAAVPFNKLCGISLEAHAGGVCVGMGVNVWRPADGAPVPGKNVPAYLGELGFCGTMDDLCLSVLDELEALYRTWESTGFASLLVEYTAHAALTGRAVCMADQVGNVMVEGVAESVDAQGRLLVRTAAGALVPVSSGEAHLL